MTDERLNEIERDAPRITMHDAERGIEIIYELTAAHRTLQQQNKQMKEKLEWAARIIDSGMYGGALRYDPLLWFKEYHELIQGVESNA